MRDLLKERERGFEAEYFNKLDAKLIEKIRERAHLQEVALALAEKLQVDDPALLARVAGLGLTRDTGGAILLAPLVQVAWADGEVSDRERETILEQAASRGILAGTPPHAQLLTWLRERPVDDLFDVALEVLTVGFGVLPPAERGERIGAMLEACDRVAEASGGLAKLLGLARRVSGEEAAVLEALTKKLRRPATPA
jgi:hypothetical protein